MNTKIQIKSIFGQVLFELEKENNSIKETIEEAVKSGASLVGANLVGANLVGADLSSANLPIYCKWYHSVKDGFINIGCKSKTPQEWEKWLESDEEFETKRGADEFKQIEAVIRAYIAYLKVLNQIK